jgi:hypothetical protein
MGLKGIHSDTGSEFINKPVDLWCQRHGVEFSRGRPANCATLNLTMAERYPRPRPRRGRNPFGLPAQAKKEPGGIPTEPPGGITHLTRENRRNHGPSRTDTDKSANFEPKVRFVRKARGKFFLPMKTHRRLRPCWSVSTRGYFEFGLPDNRLPKPVFMLEWKHGLCHSVQPRRFQTRGERGRHQNGI